MPLPRSAVSSTHRSTRRPVPVVAVALAGAVLVAACGGAGSATPAPSSAPTTAPTPIATPIASPAADQITHPTGATEVVLRYDVGGGFVPIEFLAAHVPQFTLYGDGTAIFVGTDTRQANPNGPATSVPLRAARLTEAQVQGLLLFALRDCRLAIAKAEYTNQMVADAPTTTFTINAEGDSKTVNAYALGMVGDQPGPDTATLAALQRLAERLGSFEATSGITGEAYVAKGYRGVLTNAQGAGGIAVAPWPWADLKVKDFTFPEDANALQQGKRILTLEQVQALGIDGAENGLVGGLWIKGDDGILYSLVIRPLLPDEKE